MINAFGIVVTLTNRPILFIIEANNASDAWMILSEHFRRQDIELEPAAKITRLEQTSPANSRILKLSL